MPHTTVGRLRHSSTLFLPLLLLLLLLPVPRNGVECPQFAFRSPGSWTSPAATLAGMLYVMTSSIWTVVKKQWEPVCIRRLHEHDHLCVLDGRRDFFGFVGDHLVRAFLGLCPGVGFYLVR